MLGDGYNTCMLVLMGVGIHRSSSHHSFVVPNEGAWSDYYWKHDTITIVQCKNEILGSTLAM